MSDNIREIAQRTVGLNPVYPNCMRVVDDYLDWGELKLATEFFFQSILTPQDALIDVSLHDFIYMAYVSRVIGAGDTNVAKVVQALEAEVIPLYS